MQPFGCVLRSIALTAYHFCSSLSSVLLHCVIVSIFSTMSKAAAGQGRCALRYSLDPLRALTYTCKFDAIHNHDTGGWAAEGRSPAAAWGGWAVMLPLVGSYAPRRARQRTDGGSERGTAQGAVVWGTTVNCRLAPTKNRIKSVGGNYTKHNI